MANVSIKFNGKEYLLSCEDGQEEHLEELASNLNIKFEELRSSLGNIGENRLLLITSIKVMDEYYETKKKISQKKNELEKITTKFKELKSLVYDYKKKQEDQIKNLNNDYNELENLISQNKQNYEKVLDDAANQIEEFLNNLDTQNSIQ
tara:strand:- start:38 stop:484 length:447 start_codon:yes stop_codon:yes gene_type:complete